MWEFSGAVVDEVDQIYPANYGVPEGVVVISRTFDVTNATFSLKNTGPWCAPGDSDYTFTVT